MGSDLKMVIRMAGLALLCVAIASASDDLSVVSFNDDQASCESAHTATKAVCDAFDLESEACLTANLAFQKRCNLADLGESNGPNVLEGADGLEKMSKEALIGQVQKFKMAYALEKRSAIAMRSDFSAKLKRCNHLANKDKEASDSKALKKKEEKKEFDDELNKVEKGGN